MLRSSMMWVLFLFAVLLPACTPGPIRAQPQAGVAPLALEDVASVLGPRPQRLNRAR
ncbi:hypothetical protein MAE02_69230 [Microvirga aerophila]|uniref:Uncharacterized protein n=1 Tax=Microvirga aerophila TaxID=670291 RepID=A0A512C596_9HYPH|nr:hypothetical protein MAE02_69230 [Microvirga aerophila]